MVSSPSFFLHFLLNKPFVGGAKNFFRSDASLIDSAAFSSLHSVLTAVHGPRWSRGYVLF
jgi:hypothetical protein